MAEQPQTYPRAFRDATYKDQAFFCVCVFIYNKENMDGHLVTKNLACAREIMQNSLTKNSSKFGDLIQTFGCKLSIL